MRAQDFEKRKTPPQAVLRPEGVWMSNAPPKLLLVGPGAMVIPVS